MQNNSLKPQDIVKIIKAAQEAKVQKIEYQGLLITFEPAYNSPNPTNLELRDMVGAPISDSSTDSERPRAEDLDDLLLSDPALYEERLGDDELDTGIPTS